jgi:hypothetical protein
MERSFKFRKNTGRTKAEDKAKELEKCFWLLAVGH